MHGAAAHVQGAAMAKCHSMFLEVGPRLWPGEARVKGVARGGHLATFSVPQRCK